jgi:hypothetical protein
LGNLNGETTPGADGAASVAITLTFNDPNLVEVAENALRGGIVAVDGSSLSASPSSGLVDSAGCFPSCVDYNLTKKKASGTDNVVNTADLTNFINYVNDNKPGDLFVVPATDPDFDPDYDFNKTGPVNTADLTLMINFVNDNKPGDLFVVNCLTCGC